MPHLFFHLQNTPEDEAEEVRCLLHENHIDFYETSAGRWRVGLAAIWLPDVTQKQKAEALLEDYQKKRFHNFAVQRDQLRKQGLFQGMLEKIHTQPLQFFAALAGIIVVLAISVLPFVY